MCVVLFMLLLNLMRREKDKGRGGGRWAKIVNAFPQAWIEKHPKTEERERERERENTHTGTLLSTWWVQ
jgi:hypothetical protein